MQAGQSRGDKGRFEGRNAHESGRDRRVRRDRRSRGCDPYRGKLDAKHATDLFAVTTRTKEILGVATTVVHDRVFSKAS